MLWLKMLILQNLNKIVYGLFFGALISMILHNGIYAIFNIEEPVFIILTLICLFAVLGFSLYSFVRRIVKKDVKVWKIGWLGLILLVFFLIIGMNNYWIYILPLYFCLFFMFKWLK